MYLPDIFGFWSCLSVTHVFHFICHLPPPSSEKASPPPSAPSFFRSGFSWDWAAFCWVGESSFRISRCVCCLCVVEISIQFELKMSSWNGMAIALHRTTPGKLLWFTSKILCVTVKKWCFACQQYRRNLFAEPGPNFYQAQIYLNF